MRTIWNAIVYVTIRGVLAGAVLGALYGTVFFSILGSVFGAVFSGIVGLLAGIGCGLWIGALTHVFFYPLTDPLVYRRAVTISTTAAGFLGAAAVFCVLFGVPDLAFLLRDGWILVQVPALIAAGAAFFVSRGYATRYVEEKRKKEKPKREPVYV